jgi:hypothetical protein
MEFKDFFSKILTKRIQSTIATNTDMVFERKTNNKRVPLCIGGHLSRNKAKITNSSI